MGTKSAKQRLTWIAIAFVLYGVAIFVKLLYVQVVQYDELSTLAKENWDREIPFSTQRGEIVDRKGEVIVTNELAPTMYFMPAQNENKEQVADALSQVLNKDKTKLLAKLQQRLNLVKIAPEAKISPMIRQSHSNRCKFQVFIVALIMYERIHMVIC